MASIGISGRGIGHRLVCTAGLVAFLAVSRGSLPAGVIVSRGAGEAEREVIDAIRAKRDGGEEDPIRPALDQAVEAFRKGEPETALGILEATANKHPGEIPSPRYLLARLFLAVNQPVPARRELEKLLAKERDFAPAYIAFGSLALLEGRWTDAELQFRRAAELKLPAAGQESWRRQLSVEIDEGLARVAEHRQDWRNARQSLERAVKLSPNDPLLRQRLARALFSLKETEACERELAKAFTFKPEAGPPEMFLGLFATAADDFAAAEKWLQIAVRSHPKNVAALREYAAWLLNRQRADEAAVPAQQALGLQPGDRHLQYLCGVIARYRGRIEEAEEYFAAITTQAPADLEAANQLALALVDQKSSEKRNRGLQLAISNVRQASRNRELLATLGWAYYRTGRLGEARGALDASIAGGEGPAVAGYYLARVLDQQGERAQLRILLEAAAGGAQPHYHHAATKQWLASLEK